VIHFGSLSPLGYFFAAAAVFASIVEIWALADAATRPAQAFIASGKQSKQLWLIILGVSTVVGLWYAIYAAGLAVAQILPVAAFVAAAVYLTDVRPKVKDFRGGGGTSNGPYGPW
jgi:hypothetical protein